MVATSLNDSMAMLTHHRQKRSQFRRGTGTPTLAGIYWPVDPTTRARMEEEVKFAFHEARVMITKAHSWLESIKRTNDPTKVQMMETWFGVRPAQHNQDWWEGVSLTMKHLQLFLNADLQIFYRGSRNLVNQPNDFPHVPQGTMIVDADIDGIAESRVDVSDGVIALCEDFFKKKKKGGAEMARTGYDSIGGTLVHELSHNVCFTLDQEYRGETCYGTEDALGLASDPNEGHRAWWNADNIEYFCEQLHYTLKTPGVTPFSTLIAQRAQQMQRQSHLNGNVRAFNNQIQQQQAQAQLAHAQRNRALPGQLGPLPQAPVAPGARPAPMNLGNQGRVAQFRQRFGG